MSSAKYDIAPPTAPGDITISIAEYAALLRDREKLRQLEVANPETRPYHWKPIPNRYWAG